MLMLKRYGNLLYTVFLDTCPLFKAIMEVIRALREYSREARKCMTLSTKGYILWIILLQSRKFSLGEVNMLCEFTTIHEGIRANRAAILHSEIPSELLQNSEPNLTPPVTAKTPPTNPTIDVDAIPKWPRVATMSNWHPKLRTALQGPLKTAGNPTFTKIMNYCKKYGYNISPKRSPVCTPNDFLGLSFLAKSAPNGTQ